jgi:predicted O-methyltransferase YrrM
MKRSEVEKAVAGLCCMTPEQATAIGRLITEHGYRQVLELGFRHGVSTCYIAAALQDNGGGHLTTIDLEGARTENPSVLELLARLGLQQHVTVHFEPTSYTWRLMKMLQAGTGPCFDLVYIDGAHDWFTDGFAFCLVDRLLLPGGTIVFDDLDWTYDTSPSMKGSERVLRMPTEERSTPQVRQVYELLVKTHPDYVDFVERDDWAFARKRSNAETAVGAPRREMVYQTTHVGLGAALLTLARRVARR